MPAGPCCQAPANPISPYPVGPAYSFEARAGHPKLHDHAIIKIFHGVWPPFQCPDCSICTAAYQGHEFCRRFQSANSGSLECRHRRIATGNRGYDSQRQSATGRLGRLIHHLSYRVPNCLSIYTVPGLNRWNAPCRISSTPCKSTGFFIYQ